MTPEEIREARLNLRLSARQLAEACGYADGRTVRAWESGEYPIPKSVAGQLRRLRSERRQRLAATRKAIKEMNLSKRDTEVLKRIAEGDSYAAVARDYGVSRERVRQIWQRSGLQR